MTEGKNMDSKTFSQILEAEERPATTVLLPNSSLSVAVPTVLRREAQWAGEVPESFQAVYGKPKLDFEGQLLYPEFIVLRLLERAGWTGVWVKNFHGRREFWTDIKTDLILPLTQLILFEAIEKRTGNFRGGCWDIFAWHGGEILFVESKKRKGRLTDKQRTWLEKALEHGLLLSSFLIAEYEKAEPTGS